MIRRKRARERRRRLHGVGLWWTFAAGLVAAAAVLVAIVQNSQRVRLHYLAWHVNVSLIVVVLTTALIAFLLDEVGGLIWRRRRRSMLEERTELQQLRTAQPAVDVPEVEPSVASEARPETAG